MAGSRPNIEQEPDAGAASAGGSSSTGARLNAAGGSQLASDDDKQVGDVQRLFHSLYFQVELTLPAGISRPLNECPYSLGTEPGKEFEVEVPNRQPKKKMADPI